MWFGIFYCESVISQLPMPACVKSYVLALFKTKLVKDLWIWKYLDIKKIFIQNCRDSSYLTLIQKTFFAIGTYQTFDIHKSVILENFQFSINGAHNNAAFSTYFKSGFWFLNYGIKNSSVVSIGKETKYHIYIRIVKHACKQCTTIRWSVLKKSDCNALQTILYW